MTTDAGDRAWVLHRYAYGDSSLIVEFFSQQYGRLGMLAKGARRPRSAFASIEAGRPLWIRWLGKGDLPLLVQAEELGTLLPLNTLQNLSLFYMNELLLRLTRRGDPFPEFFAEYENTIKALSDVPNIAWNLRRYERHLLEALGWAADLGQCGHCGIPLSPGTTWFYAAQSGVFCPRHAPGEASVAIPAEVLEWLSGPMNSAPACGYNAHLRQYLERELQVHLGSRALESRRLLAAYLQRGKQIASH
ncbi:DNA repair protein RecO [Acidithiobacillus montserratensis]|uniref:DNA repair protein RecO n=1 Tax=Acidithiobacillus montserratensis TaxID=2729135 RepID=A0ACD5HBK3_9PROT|nr:DNA repair protein RecO [Acidithiobacillus montserratensis]MBN2679654.1 DNA repair protein RecO [Acidithiobacillaceae bacterium]MBU2746682.1 DNA repair protein RecO [Acidithiobacillus montserratensis]